MNPKHRVKPSYEVIQALKVLYTTGVRTVRDIADEYGVDRSCVRHWFSSPPPKAELRPTVLDPAGFESACMEVFAGASGITATARKWRTERSAVRETIERLTGKPFAMKRVNAAKTPRDKQTKYILRPQPDASRHVHRTPSEEKSKRERLKQEVQQLLAQPLGAP